MTAARPTRLALRTPPAPEPAPGPSISNGRRGTSESLLSTVTVPWQPRARVLAGALGRGRRRWRERYAATERATVTLATSAGAAAAACRSR